MSYIQKFFQKNKICVTIIRINSTWDELIKEAKEIAIKELSILENQVENKWFHEFDILKKIITDNINS